MAGTRTHREGSERRLGGNYGEGHRGFDGHSEELGLCPMFHGKSLKCFMHRHAQIGPVF